MPPRDHSARLAPHDHPSETLTLSGTHADSVADPPTSPTPLRRPPSARTGVRAGASLLDHADTQQLDFGDGPPSPTRPAPLPRPRPRLPRRYVLPVPAPPAGPTDDVLAPRSPDALPGGRVGETSPHSAVPAEDDGRMEVHPAQAEERAQEVPDVQEDVQERSGGGREDEEAPAHAGAERTEGGDSPPPPLTLPIPTPTPAGAQVPRGASGLNAAIAEEQDVIKILVTTDNHVGFMEHDPVRGQDALNSFREALHIAQEEKVDMILLAGDLFHENNPSRNTLHQVMAALREYTMGSRPLGLAYVSDPREAAHPKYKFGAVNYLEEYYNVSIPVFAIHGNHDDRQGLGSDGPLSALDLLSTAGLINYLGKNNLPLGSSSRRTEDQRIDVRPALMQKGRTKLALYGLSNLRDERLTMELRMRRVRMFQPVEESDTYFNLLAVHQNRCDRGTRTVIPEGAFDDSIDLIVWGHEHEQRTDPEPVPQRSYRICQPGSTVITSLSQGEEPPKSVALLTIAGKDYTVKRRELQTVRPFVLEDFDLEEELANRGIVMGGERSQKQVIKMLEAKIECLIEKAAQQWVERQGQLGTPEDEVAEMPLPLIRLRVNFEKHEVGNLVRFGSKFLGRVANPKELLGFNRKRTQKRKRAGEAGPAFVDPTSLEEMGVMERLENLDLNKMVSSVVQSQEFEGLPALIMDQGLQTSVDKDVKNALRDMVQQSIKRQCEAALRLARDTDEVDPSLLESYQREVDLAKSRYGDVVPGGRQRRRRDATEVDQGGRDEPMATTPQNTVNARDAEDMEEQQGFEEQEDIERPDPAVRGGGGGGRWASRGRTATGAATPAPGHGNRRTRRDATAVEGEQEEEAWEAAPTTRRGPAHNTSTHTRTLTRTRRAGALPRQTYSEQPALDEDDLDQASDNDDNENDEDEDEYRLSAPARTELFLETQASQVSDPEGGVNADVLPAPPPDPPRRARGGGGTQGTKRPANFSESPPDAHPTKRAAMVGDSRAPAGADSFRGGDRGLSTSRPAPYSLALSRASSHTGPRPGRNTTSGSPAAPPRKPPSRTARPTPVRATESGSSDVEVVGASQAPPLQTPVQAQEQTQSQYQAPRTARARRRF